MTRILIALVVLLMSCGDGRLSPQGGTITGATTNGGLVVTSGRLGLLTTCADDEVIKFDLGTSTWACGTVTSFSTLNTIPKGDGAGMVASGLTDDGSSIVSGTGYHIRTGLVYGNTPDTSEPGFRSTRNATSPGTVSSNQWAFGYSSTTTDFVWNYWNGSAWSGPHLTLTTAGNVSVPGSLTSGDGAGDVFDHNGDLAKFGSSDGVIFLDNGSGIGFAYASNGESTGSINYAGYQNGFTQFRNLQIYDGKGAASCLFTGSTKTLNCVGGLQVNGAAVNAFSTSNVIPKGNGTTLVASGLSDDTATLTSTTPITRIGTNGGDAVTAAGLNVGQDTASTTATHAGWAVTPYTDGNVYVDTKVGNGDSTLFRTGHNTSAGSTLTWLAVAGSTAAVSFPGSVSSGDAAGDVFDHNGNLAKFGNGDGDVYVYDNQINSHYANAADNLDLWLNYRSASTTFDYFRNTIIGDGKGVAVATFTGSDKSVDFDGSFFKFGSTDGYFYIHNAGINFEHSSNALATGYINYNGYQNGTTQFRNLSIRDGKSAEVALFDGAAKSLAVVGNLSTAAGLTAGDADGDSHLLRGVMTLQTTGVDSSPLFVFQNDAEQWHLAIDGSSDTFSVSETGVATWTRWYAGGEFEHIGNTQLGDTTADSHIIYGTTTVNATPGGPAVFALNGSAGQTANALNVLSQMTGSADTTAAARTLVAVYATNTSTRSAGANNLTNYGVYAEASGAQANYSGYFAAGSFNVDGAADFNSTLAVDGNTQLGDTSADRVGIGIAPDSEHAMRFAQALGNKIALYPIDGTNAFGFGIQADKLQYFVGGNSYVHSFGYGDSDAFTEAFRIDADGQVWAGDTASTSVSDNVDVFTIGNTGTGQTTTAKALINATNSGTYSTVGSSVTVYGGKIVVTATESAGDNILTNTALHLSASGADTNIALLVDQGSTNLGGNLTVDGNTTLGNGSDLVAISSRTTMGWDTADGNRTLTISRNPSSSTLAIEAASILMSGSADTTGISNTSTGLSILAQTTEVGGTNTLTNTALSLDAQNGDVNIALQISNGNVILGTTTISDSNGAVIVDDSLTANGNVILGDANTDAHTFKGAITHTEDTGIAYSVTNTPSAGTAVVNAITATTNGTLNTTSGELTTWSIIGSAQTTKSAGSSNLINIGVYGVASGGDLNYSFYGAAGTFYNAGQTVFGNGPSGINNYDGTHLEWSDEWMMLAAASAINALPIGSVWEESLSGTGTSIAEVTGQTTRPGVAQIETGTTTTGRFGLYTGLSAIDFGSGNWSMMALVQWPTLSTSGEEYANMIGFYDSASAVNVTDGCWAFYDRGGVTTGLATTGDKFKFGCASNGTRTLVILDGTTQGGVVTVDSPIVAATWYRVEVVMTGDTSAAVKIDGTTRATITTNIPTGSTRVTGAGMNIIKSAGSTERVMYIDASKLAVDLDAVRSP